MGSNPGSRDQAELTFRTSRAYCTARCSSNAMTPGQRASLQSPVRDPPALPFLTRAPHASFAVCRVERDMTYLEQQHKRKQFLSQCRLPFILHSPGSPVQLSQPNLIKAPCAEARTPYLAIIVPHEFLSVTKVRCFNAKILVARLSFKIAPSIGELCFGLSAHCRGLMSVTLSQKLGSSSSTHYQMKTKKMRRQMTLQTLLRPLIRVSSGPS